MRAPRTYPLYTIAVGPCRTSCVGLVGSRSKNFLAVPMIVDSQEKDPTVSGRAISP